ncbi:MAG: hypothetical protein ACKV22_07645 [Bryobacteraceae bacterium]
MKELFAEVTLRLGGLEERVRDSIGKPGLRQVFVVRRNLQLVDTANLLVDEMAQLIGVAASIAIIVMGDRSATEERNGQGDGCSLQQSATIDRLRERRARS